MCVQVEVVLFDPLGQVNTPTFDLHTTHNNISGRHTKKTCLMKIPNAKLRKLKLLKPKY
jgi:hypothetical protein